MHITRFLALLVFTISAFFQLAADGPSPTPASEEVLADLSAAFSDRLQTNSAARSLTFDLFTPELDTAFTSPDGETAVLWLALRDDTGRRLASEPGLALAKRSDQGWSVLLPGDPGWDETIASLPEGMLPQELSPAPSNAALGAEALAAPLRGYYLPYAAGTARWLEGSISHFQSIPELGYPSCTSEYCRYAYDFTDSWHFPLLASKSGKVIGSRDTCTDGSTTCTNYIVLFNSTDQAYQIYLHLAQGTIPNSLATGTNVQRGQYIGDSDDTGYSTSQHVHFMVTSSIWMGNSGYYWGRSIDIRFADVTINDGIPRNCYEVTHFQIYDGATQCLGDRSNPRDPDNDWFTSGNVGAFPPSGTFSHPVAGAVVASGESPLVDFTVSATDDVRVTGVSLLAKLSGQWVEIGSKLTQPNQSGQYHWNVNLCSLGPLNGSLEVAMRVWDHEGNIADAVDAHSIWVDHACPPPTSQLNPVETFDSTAMRLTWDGASAGAGLSAFELQYRTLQGSWDPANILTYPAGTRSAWLVAGLGGSFAFRMRALDANGQPEAWPAGGAFEASVTLPASCTPDSFEPDDSPAQAKALALGVSTQRNLCDAGDPDWFRVDVENADDYYVNAPSVAGAAAVIITVYAGDGQTVLANGQSAGVAQGAGVRFHAAAPGIYYIKVEPLISYLVGTNAVYGITVSEARQTFLPLMVR